MKKETAPSAQMLPGSARYVGAADSRCSSVIRLRRRGIALRGLTESRTKDAVPPHQRAGDEHHRRDETCASPYGFGDRIAEPAAAPRNPTATEPAKCR